MSIEYKLVCDMCECVIDGSTNSASDVRRVAKREGTAHRYKGEDLCNWCYPKVQKAEAEPQR